MNYFQGIMNLFEYMLHTLFSNEIFEYFCYAIIMLFVFKAVRTMLCSI